VVECNLAKVDVAGSTPVSRSIFLSMICKKYKAVIFDLDGTLIDSMHIWRQVDREFLGKRGIQVPGDLFDHLPQGNSYNQTAQYFKDRFDLPESVEDIMNEWTQRVCWHYENDMALKPEVKVVIEWLTEQQIPVGMGTSNSHDLAKAALNQHSLLSHFKTIISGCEDMKGKPFPDIYLKAASKLGVSPSDCIVIEDTLSGIRAAKNAGMYAIAIYDEDSEGQRELINAEADYSAQDYQEVLEALQGLL
jgi:HAD superfamily hydrolase (TIGR01509 family)